jgi:hypothetical protein
MTPSEVYAEMLKAEGLLVQAGSEGRLHFKYEGDRYELLTYADDLQYFGISATYRIPAGVRRSRTLTEANELTRRSKVVKVYVIPNRGVTIAAELFVQDPERLDTVLPRLLRLVQAVAAEYFGRLADGAPAPA